MDAHLYQSNRQNRRRERERNASGDPSAHNSRVRATLSLQLSLTGEPGKRVSLEGLAGARVLMFPVTQTWLIKYGVP